MCNLHLLFIEEFEYHRQSMILLSPLFQNLYQIYALIIGVDLTLTLRVHHFLLELQFMLSIDGNTMLSVNSDFTINYDFFDFVQ